MRLRKLFFLTAISLSVVSFTNASTRCDANRVHFVPTVTSESMQIAIDKSEEEDTVGITSRDFGRGIKEASYSAEGGIFTIDVGLKLGENKFDFLFYKKSDLISSCSITIKRVTSGGAATASSPVRNQISTQQSNESYTTSSNNLIEKPSAPITPASYIPQPVTEIKSGPKESQEEISNVALNATTGPVKNDSPPPTKSTNILPATPPTSPAIAKTSNKNNPVRLIFGFEQAGASSTSSKGQPFIDLMTDIRVNSYFHRHECFDDQNNKIAKTTGCANRIKFEYPFTFWSNIRLTSIASQTLPDFGGLTDAAVTSFFGANQSGKVNDIVQAFQVRFGLEQSLGKGFGLIAGVGATSPLSAEKTVTAYKIPHTSAGGDASDDFKKIFGPNTDFSKLNTLILTLGDRDRFNRNWFVGGRLRKQFIDDDDAYPATFELTFGQDEVLTNKLIGGVMKFDSFVPIPFKGLKFLYFGASFTSKLTRKVKTVTLPFFLEPATNTNLFGNDVFVRNVRDIPELNSDRDFFSFRFGVDLIGLIKKSNEKKETKPPSVY